MLAHFNCRKISLRIPDRVDAQIRLLLNELESQRKDFKAELAKRPMSHNDDFHRTEETLLNTSYKVLSSGRTLYSGSAFGESIKQESIFASARVNDWIRRTGAIEELAAPSSAADTRPSSVFSGTNNDRRKSCLSDDIASASRPTDVSGDTTPEVDAETASDESYSEDELDVEAAQHAIKLAKSAFDAKDYTQTSDILQEALTMINTLPKKSQAMHDGCDMRYMLGICSFYIYEPAEAKEALLAVVENPPRAGSKDDIRAHYVPNASHLLAQAYVRLGKLEEARSSCHSTLKGRAKLHSKTHESYFESLALMARIVELQGTPLRAKFYAAGIPSNQVEALADKFKGLNSIMQDRMADTSSVATHVVETTGAVERESVEEAATLPSPISNDQQTHSSLEDSTEPEDTATSLRTRRHSDAVASAVEVNTRGSISLASVADEGIHIRTPPRVPVNVDRTVSDGNINMTTSSTSPRYQRAAASDSQMPRYSVRNGQGPRTWTSLAELMSERQYIEPPTADVATRRRLLRLLDGDSSSLFKADDTTTDLRKLLLRALVYNDNSVEVARQQHTKPAGRSLISRAFGRVAHETLYVWESHLHLASLFGDYEVVTLLLSAGAKVNSTCVPGYTALHLAALAGHRNIVEALLDFDSDLDHSANGLGTPLFLAVAGRRLDVVDLLLRHRASLDGSYVGLGTVAHVACATGDLAFVHALFVDTLKREIRSGPKRNSIDARIADVWSSASRISTARVRELLRLSRTDPAESFLTQKSRHLIPELSNVTPLALAAYAGAPDVVQFLISRGFDPGAQCFILSDTQQQRSSALDLACRSGHAEVVAILLEHVNPAKIQTKNCLDRSYDPSNELSAAVLNGNTACVASLLDRGMRIWLMLLLKAIRDGREHIIRLFVDHRLSAELVACALRDRAPPEGTKEVSDAEKRCWHMLIANVDGVGTFSWPKHGGTLLHTSRKSMLSLCRTSSKLAQTLMQLTSRAIRV